MRLGIDASNIRAGGGITHLAELLAASMPSCYGFSKVIVWGSQHALNRLPDRPWLDKAPQYYLDRNLVWRIWWQARRLPKLAKTHCDVLFVPGGRVKPTKYYSVVTMSQNLLPFAKKEIRRYSLFSWQRWRLYVLYWLQLFSFRRADGIIFLTHYVKNIVSKHLPFSQVVSAVISHGVHPKFNRAPCKHQFDGYFSKKNPCRLLYVSTIDWYKHQEQVAKAIALLHQRGLHIQLDLVGAAYPPALKQLRQVLCKVNEAQKIIHYHGNIDYQRIHQIYHQADIFVFASSCETFGQILLEAMASALPIVCSELSAMPEILQDAGLYCNPYCPEQIAEQIQRLYKDSYLRQRLAAQAHQRAQKYTWSMTAEHTFKFLQQFISR